MIQHAQASQVCSTAMRLSQHFMRVTHPKQNLPQSMLHDRPPKTIWCLYAVAQHLLGMKSDWLLLVSARHAYKTAICQISVEQVCCPCHIVIGDCPSRQLSVAFSKTKVKLVLYMGSYKYHSLLQSLTAALTGSAGAVHTQ